MYFIKCQRCIFADYVIKTLMTAVFGRAPRGSWRSPRGRPLSPESLQGPLTGCALPSTRSSARAGRPGWRPAAFASWPVQWASDQQIQKSGPPTGLVSYHPDPHILMTQILLLIVPTLHGPTTPCSSCGPPQTGLWDGLGSPASQQPSEASCAERGGGRSVPPHTH